MKFSEMFDKKYLSRVALFVVMVAASVGVLFYVGFHFIERFSSNLELVDARLSTVTETISVDAYIMRDEKPIYSSVANGSIVPEQHAGSHVNAGGLIAEVYSNSSPDIERRIDEIDEQIALFEKNKAENRSVQSTAGIEKSIYSTIYSMRKSAESGNYADSLSLRTSLIVDIKKRAILTGEITDYDAQISKLERERESLRSQLGTCLQKIYADRSAYFFSDYDGYGDVFRADRIDSMTFADFEEMTSSVTQDSRSAIGILVSDYKWYIACLMTKAEAATLEELGRCDVSFPYSGTSMKMSVERIIPEMPGTRAVAILCSGKIPEGFDYTRMQPVEISARQYTGFELPAAAVRVVDGHEGVYVMDEVTIAFRRINIIREKSGTVICTGEPTDDIVIINEKDDSPAAAENQEYEWIKQNDVVVVGGTGLYAGKVIG